MHCPHCSAELHEQSAFCGVCGKPLPADAAAAPRRAGVIEAAITGASSVFELPVNPQARLLRVLLVLVFDAALAAGGVWMIVSYLHARDARGAASAPASGAKTAADEPKIDDAVVDVPPPRVISRKNGKKGTGRKPATVVAIADPRKPRRPGTGTGTGTGTGAAVGASVDAGSPTDTGTATGTGTGTATASDTATDTGTGTATDPGTGTGTGTAAATDPTTGTGSETATDPTATDPSESEQLTADEVQQVVQDHRGAISRCYSLVAKQSADSNLPQGRLEIAFTIQPSGTATDVQVASNATGSDDLGKCVAAQLASWKFPSPGAGPMQLVWPFVFHAPGHG